MPGWWIDPRNFNCYLSKHGLDANAGGSETIDEVQLGRYCIAMQLHGYTWR